MSFHEKVVFITGASSGIGEAIARELAREGAKLAITARRIDRLEQLADEVKREGGEALALACDVTRDGDLEAAVRATVERFGRIDVVVANAGFGVTGRVQRLTIEDFRRQLETNFFGVLRTAYAALPELERTKGTLALVGSVSAYLSTPGTAAYAVSKFGVRALAEALTWELRPKGVAVTLINPGFVESEIRSVSNEGRAMDRPDPIPTWLMMPKATAARKIARAIDRRERELVLTGHGKLAVLLARHAPSVVRTALRFGAAWEPTKS